MSKGPALLLWLACIWGAVAGADAGADTGQVSGAVPGAAPGAVPGTVPGAAFAINGDGIEKPLSAAQGDALRGRAIVADRRTGLCLLCHRGPIPEERFQGDLAPDLAGAGARWTEAQLRLRIVDAARLNPQTIMPPYFRSEGLQEVGKAWQGQTIFTAQQVEDVVAYLKTLK